MNIFNLKFCIDSSFDEHNKKKLNSTSIKIYLFILIQKIVQSIFFLFLNTLLLLSNNIFFFVVWIWLFALLIFIVLPHYNNNNKKKNSFLNIPYKWCSQFKIKNIFTWTRREETRREKKNIVMLLCHCGNY